MKWKNAATEKPDADQIVLIYCEGKSEPVWLGYFDDEKSMWYGEDGFSLQVTHWMELPEPPAASR